MIGDSILVHIIYETEVALQFHGSFKVYAPGQQFLIQFKLNHITVQHQHQAMNAAFMVFRCGCSPSCRLSRLVPISFPLIRLT